MIDVFTITENEIVEIESTIKDVQSRVTDLFIAHGNLEWHLCEYGPDENLSGDVLIERNKIRSTRLLAKGPARGFGAKYSAATIRAREINECALTIRKLCKEHDGIAIIERPKDGDDNVLWRHFGAYDQNTEQPFVIVLGYDMDMDTHSIGMLTSLDGDYDFEITKASYLQCVSRVYNKSVALRIADEIDAHIDAIRQRIGSFL